ncbi:MAG: gluconate 2-dehydrogenase subunit 3 family protein [Cyclobacteriaceae bacterium]|nr:gluconate 2-dehydrogenase subunit 3 family protein [Cyclobacteriaceae bacterium]
MDRREALKRTAWIMGGVVSAPAIAGILKGCAAKPTIDWKPVFVSEDQGIVIAQVAEIIIPKTDTPGAKETGVPGFIDLMLKDVYSKEDQDHFLEGLKAFDEEAKKAHGDVFIELSAEKQAEFVKKVHDDAIAAQKTEPRPKRPFILMMKELTMLGFFTSEAGATQVLQYVAVPGAYKGCIPLSEAGNGKTWAS